MVLLSSVWIPRVPTYSGSPSLRNDFAYGTFTLFRLPFQVCSAIFTYTYRGPYPVRIATHGLGSSDFARHYFRNRFYFLFLRVMRCFSSPGSLHYAMYLRNDTMTLLIVSSLIRISADRYLFAIPRSFSQLVTSFFGAMYLGILLYALCSLILSDSSSFDFCPSN